MFKKSAIFGAVVAGVYLAASSAHAISITQNNSASALAALLAGSGISIVGGSESVTGGAVQFGGFSSGTSAVGFSSGVVLSSGDVKEIEGDGVNTSTPETLGAGGSGTNSLSTSVGSAGDAGLTALSGVTTFDAAVLEFDFTFDNPTGGDLFFNFVFASEEYLDYVNTTFNDVFGFWVDGTQIALTPGGDPITINNINPLTNAGLYVNNVDNTDGYANANRPFEFDGLTTVLTAQALALGGGVHSMKFAVADGADSILDAGVFLQGGSFSNEMTVVPVPAALPLFLSGLLGLGVIARRRRKMASA